MTIKNVKRFREEDHNRTLFPLSTTSVLVEHGARKIADHISRIADRRSGPSFLSQEHVFADKSNHHLRRTLKLDPIAEYCLYDIVYRNRSAFKATRNGLRRSYGYRFSRGSVPPPSKSYKEYSRAVLAYARQYQFYVAFDISCYFNSIYHHDLASRMRHIMPAEDSDLIGMLLRQINAGRSTDCLPHGLMPAKVIGSDFLSFTEGSSRIQSPVMCRFMDDFMLFSNREYQLLADFYHLQDILSSKSLFVNPAKTRIEESRSLYSKHAADRIKIRLLRIRRELIMSSEGADGDLEEPASLGEEETRYLLSLLEEDDVSEQDAELALTLLRDSADAVLEHLFELLRRFPNLSKNAFHFCAHVTDTSGLAWIVHELVGRNSGATQFQLFWLTSIAEHFLSADAIYGEILHAIFGHPRSSAVTKARVLEIGDRQFGLSDLRSEQLRSGGSGWLPWASAVGSLCEDRATRNHLLGYFANASDVNRLFAEILRDLPMTDPGCGR